MVRSKTTDTLKLFKELMTNESLMSQGQIEQEIERDFNRY